MIHLITPCHRLKNLPRILESIETELKGLSWHWWCVVDDRLARPPQPIHEQQTIFKAHPAGTSFGAGFLRNQALQRITDGWVYDLDDDTILHPSFRTFLDCRSETIRAIFFDLVRPDGSFFAGPRGPYGTGTSVIRRDAIIGEWICDTYDCDQAFLGAQISGIPQDQQLRFDMPGAYYNFLEDKNDGPRGPSLALLS